MRKITCHNISKTRSGTVFLPGPSLEWQLELWSECPWARGWDSSSDSSLGLVSEKRRTFG